MTYDPPEVGTAMSTEDIDAILASIPKAPRVVENCHDCGARRQMHEYWIEGSPNTIGPNDIQATCKRCSAHRWRAIKDRYGFARRD